MDPEPRVCPDCGEAAGQQPFCASCGRNLTSLDRLPTRGEWVAAQDQQDEKDRATETRDSDRPPLDAATQPEPQAPTVAAGEEPKRRPTAILALLASGVVVAVVVGALLATAGGGGGVDEAAEVEAEVEAALADRSGGIEFAQLADATAIACKPDGTLRNVKVFKCSWDSGSQTNTARWTLFDDGNLARVSQGGSSGSPPQDASEAANRVQAVVQERGSSGTISGCQAIVDQKTGVDLSSHAFSCVLADPSGVPLIIDGEVQRAYWQWDDDGLVGRESLDLEPRDQAADVAAGSTATTDPQSAGTGPPTTDDSSGGSDALASSCGPASRVANRTVSSVVPHGEITCEVALSAITTWLASGRPSGRFDRRGGPAEARSGWICDYQAKSGGNCSIASTLWVTFKLDRARARKSCGTVTSEYGRSKVTIAAGTVSCTEALRLASDFVNYRNVVGPNSSQTVDGWAVIPGRNGEPTVIAKGKQKITVG